MCFHMDIIELQHIGDGALLKAINWYICCTAILYRLIAPAVYVLTELFSFTMADRTPADHTAQKPDITSSIEHEPEPECSSSPIASSFVPEATARPAEKKQAIYYNDGLAARYLTSVDRSLLRLRRYIRH